MRRIHASASCSSRTPYRILDDWQRQGYPFGHLVPSYGTSIGSSGDRPDALADLMGIILNDGVRLPSVDVQRLHFAADTPYETDITLNPHPQRVLAPEVARAVRETARAEGVTAS